MARRPRRSRTATLQAEALQANESANNVEPLDTGPQAGASEDLFQEESPPEAPTGSEGPGGAKETPSEAPSSNVSSEDARVKEGSNPTGNADTALHLPPFKIKSDERLSSDTTPWHFEHPLFSRRGALRFVQIQHSLVFFLFAVSGVVTLIFIKSINNEFGHFVYFVVVLSFMATYFLINMSDFAGLKLRYDHLGDNLYYLGFVYTLGTLGYTLFKFNGDVDNIYGVVSSFGIALSSTVLGVVLRIVAHQLHVDPHEVEDAVRSDLADLTSRLRGALDIVVRDMTIFGDETRQVISELQTEVSNDIRKNVETLVAASTRVVESVDRSFEVFTENTTKVNQLSDKTVQVLAALVQKIEEIHAPADIIERNLIPATAQIVEIVALMRTVSHQVTEQAESLEKVTEAMNASITTVHEQVHTISGAANQQEIANRVTLAANALRDMTQSVTAIRDQMQNLVVSEHKAVSELREEYGRSISNIREHNEAVKRELDRFRSLTAETQEALIDLAGAMKEAI